MGETEFEKPRGISRVEVRSGFAQVHIAGLPEPLVNERIKVLEAVAAAGVSLDFLKFTPGGMSFLVRDSHCAALETALKGLDVRCTVQGERRVVMVHAVNMRDEEGLIASIVLQAIRAGAQVDHIADMHDRMLLVMSAKDAERIRGALESSLVGEARS